MDCPPRKKNGHCKEVETRFSVWTISQEKKMAVVKRLKQDSVYGLSAKKKNGHCREVAVVKRLKQDSVYGPYPPRKKKPL